MGERPAPLRPGDVIAGKYRVERVLGAGGMGAVVEARHVRFDDRVALKVLHEDIAERADLVERFLREGRAARQIRSEHVVQVTDVDTLPNGAPFLVMEYLEGTDLSGLLKTRGPLPVETAIEYLLQACEALAEAHTRGIVHRDLKPANLFLSKRPDGSPCVKVLDFGISKVAATEGMNLTSTASMVGTPIYMSPEQLRHAKDVDARADVWSLGVILYELLSANTPFKGETLASLALQIALEEPAPLGEYRPDVPPGLIAVIERCLAKERDARYSSIGQLAAALAPFAPERARTSLERISRLAGLTPVPQTHPPPPPTVRDAPKDMGPISAAPTIAESVPNQKPISLAVDDVRPAPRANTTGPSPVASTMAGTTSQSTASERRGSLIPWISGGAILLVAAAVGVLVIAPGKNAGKAKEPESPPLVESPPPPPETVAEPTPAPPPTPIATATSSTSASASTKPAKMPLAKQPGSIPPSTIGKPTAPASAPPTKPTSPSKSNEDY
jgi:serine/threonine-protein kinase